MIASWFLRIQQQIEQAIVGKTEVVRQALAALLAGGHLLLEDVPGTGKTTLARVLARSLGLPYRRAQMTPDLLPSDLTGVYSYHNGEFRFRPGPIFTNVLLADELNRATPKTQSALLEAMQEGQVTLEGQTHSLPQPFWVIATQNPIEQEGTYRLPEAQLDRFICRLRLHYPEPQAEREILRRLRSTIPEEALQPLSSAEEIVQLQKQVRQIHLEPDLEDYLLSIVQATRQAHQVLLGASPRAALALQRFTQAQAAIAGRDFVLPDDIQTAVVPVLAHRLLLHYEARLEGARAEQILAEISNSIPVPVEV